MYLNPAGTALYDAVFANMARTFGQRARKCTLPACRKRTGALPTSSAAPERPLFRAASTERRGRRCAKIFDALAIGCFCDTALHDAHEISGEMIVTAPCLASCETATIPPVALDLEPSELFSTAGAEKVWRGPVIGRDMSFPTLSTPPGFAESNVPVRWFAGASRLPVT